MYASKGDAILLIQDAVLALQSPISLASFVAKCLVNKIDVFALSDDCRLRGIDNQYENIRLVDYAGFIELAARHDKQVAW